MTGDLGFNVIDIFRDRFPERFTNCGVAEQSMMTMAAAIASEGYTVFAYSISNFATFRCIEQIRNDIAYHGRSVCIVAVGAGTSYGTLGYSHYGLQDVAVMRAIPGMRIYAPGTPEELEYALDNILSHQGPSYLRLGRYLDFEPPVANVNSVYEVRAGSKITVLASGTLLNNSLLASALCEGSSVQVLSAPLVSPLNIQEIVKLTNGRPIVTVEEHSVSGGLGSILLESLAELNAPRNVHVLGFPHSSEMLIGSHDYTLTNAGLNVENIASSLQRFIDLGGTANAIRG